MSEYSQGVCGDGTVILKDGLMLNPDQIVAELKRLQNTRNEWIPVSELEPELNQRVLFYNGAVVSGRWIDGCAWDSMLVQLIRKVTHWMPLPAPPKGE